MAWPKRNAPILLLAAALLASGVLLLALYADLTFFQDTWAFLMRRRAWDADAFLLPHNEHIVVIPVAIEKLLIAAFGMTSAAPEQVTMTLILLATAALLFVYVRRRLGPWAALLATAAVLFLGPAWQVLLWPFEIGFAGAILCGIATLLALDRDDRAGDRAAAVLLTIGIGFSSLGIAFALGAAADVVLKRRRGLARLYVPLAPLLVYVAWWLGWGHTAEGHVTLGNVVSSPLFLLEGLAASLASLLGLNTDALDTRGQPLWGWPLLAALAAAVAYRQWRRPGVAPGFWPAAVSAVAFWLLVAANFVPGREAYASRYMYAGAVFALLAVAGLLPGLRLRGAGLVAAVAVTAAAVASNVATLVDGRDWLREQTVLTRADLAAVEISRRTVDPGFALTPEIAGTTSLIDIQAGAYLEAVGEHGSPAYTQAELSNAPEQGRRQADIVLSQALPLSTEAGAAAGGSRARCATVPAGGGQVPLPLGPGTARIEVPPGEDAEVSLRRYATGEFPVPTEGAPAGEVTLLEIPADESRRPWRMEIGAELPVRVCPG